LKYFPREVCVLNHIPIEDLVVGHELGHFLFDPELVHKGLSIEDSRKISEYAIILSHNFDLSKASKLYQLGNQFLLCKMFMVIEWPESLGLDLLLFLNLFVLFIFIILRFGLVSLSLAAAGFALLFAICDQYTDEEGHVQAHV